MWSRHPPPHHSCCRSLAIDKQLNYRSTAGRKSLLEFLPSFCFVVVVVVVFILFCVCVCCDSVSYRRRSFVFACVCVCVFACGSGSLAVRAATVLFCFSLLELPRPEIEKKRQSYDKRQTNKRNATDENKKYKTVWFNGLRLRFRRVAPLFFFCFFFVMNPKKKSTQKKAPAGAT